MGNSELSCKKKVTSRLSTIFVEMIVHHCVVGTELFFMIKSFDELDLFIK